VFVLIVIPAKAVGQHLALLVLSAHDPRMGKISFPTYFLSFTCIKKEASK
jgi:hypothetical protein